jgi:hypothetical protein
MEAMRSTWTDSRLDDFTAETGRRFDGIEAGFDRVDKRIAAVEARMDAGFGELRSELGSLQRTMIVCFVSLSSAILAGFVAMAIQL